MIRNEDIQVKLLTEDEMIEGHLTWFGHVLCRSADTPFCGDIRMIEGVKKWRQDSSKIT